MKSAVAGSSSPTVVTALKNVAPSPYVYDIHAELAKFFQAGTPPD